LTRGRAATPDPFDLGAVNGSDELFEALSTRRLADLTAAHTPDEDPAVVLLAALVADVDAGAPPLPAPARVSCGMQGSQRRAVRAFVILGVAAMVLTSAGAAAAGGGNDVSALRTTHGPAAAAERSNENAQRHDPVSGAPQTSRRASAHRAGDRHRTVSDQPGRAPDDQLRSHRGPRPSRADSRPPADVHQISPRPDQPSSSPDSPTPTPWPDSVPLVP
jgi:hypothetical protein